MSPTLASWLVRFYMYIHVPTCKNIYVHIPAVSMLIVLIIIQQIGCNIPSCSYYVHAHDKYTNTSAIRKSSVFCSEGRQACKIEC